MGNGRGERGMGGEGREKRRRERKRGGEESFRGDVEGKERMCLYNIVISSATISSL